MCADPITFQPKAFCEIRHTDYNCEAVAGYFQNRFKRKDPCQSCTDGVIDRTRVATNEVQEVGPCSMRPNFSSFISQPIGHLDLSQLAQPAAKKSKKKKKH
ncbi:hypothetical protein S23_38520 [Bradyrhizobium cosmicum]|uniref:Uncharacterized protein n=1 Tax=Bradyrhizobium cosmicum TaxID=1404864 RepID=A0AAI8QC75_9BRAD|nr:hypothetical protein S23_38520 [Bradyrhizobium cosmicum]